MLGLAGLGLLVGLRMVEDASTDRDKAVAGLVVYVSGFRAADMLFNTRKGES